MADFTDIVFVDGWIFSAPQDSPVRAAVAVVDGRIMAVGPQRRSRLGEDIHKARVLRTYSAGSLVFRRVDESADASADHQL